MYCASSGVGDRPAVAEDDDVVAHRAAPPAAIASIARDAVVERERRRGADRAADRQAHMGDDDVGAGLGHRLGLVGLNT